MRKLLFLSLASLLLLSAACTPKTLSTVANAAPTCTVCSAAATPTESGSPEVKAAILAAMRAMMGQAHRTHSTVTLTDSGQSQESTVEYAPPDRYHVLIGSDELAVIGQVVFLKVGERWETTTQLTADQVINPDQLDYLEATIQDYQLAGNETLDGKMMKVYTYQSGYLNQTLWLVNRTRLWVGEADGLPYKINTTGDIAGVDPASGMPVNQAGISETTIEYDPTIKIDITYK